MNSLLLQAAAKIVVPIQLIFSLLTLLRGHNLPGGGFIGGLLAATAFLLLAVAHDVDRARRRMCVPPRWLMTGGLLVALSSGLWGTLTGAAFMTGHWWPDFTLPVMGGLKLGTPLLFDCGVFLVVWGITTEIAFHVMEES
ncbi:MAG: Na(+)/H(+) antiporter subunit B [Acidobacteria bacterium]|nr:Na(+)/H(+) antiporter subunit B [Acidobacteriota bacterium]